MLLYCQVVALKPFKEAVRLELDVPHALMAQLIDTISQTYQIPIATRQLVELFQQQPAPAPTVVAQPEVANQEVPADPDAMPPIPAIMARTSGSPFAPRS